MSLLVRTRVGGFGHYSCARALAPCIQIERRDTRSASSLCVCCVVSCRVFVFCACGRCACLVCEHQISRFAAVPRFRSCHSISALMHKCSLCSEGAEVIEAYRVQFVRSAPQISIRVHNRRAHQQRETKHTV